MCIILYFYLFKNADTFNAFKWGEIESVPEFLLIK